VALAPVGLTGMYARRGEVQAAVAADQKGIPFTLSEQHKGLAGNIIHSVIPGNSGSGLTAVRLNDFPVETACVIPVTDVVKKQDGTDEYGDGQHGLKDP